MRGTREFTVVGVTLDKRRGLYVVLTPRLSTEKQPLSPTYWKPPWTSVTTIVAKTYVGGGWKDATQSIRRIFIFLTLSLTVRFPTSSSHSHPSTPVWTHFFLLASRHPCRNKAAALFFLLDCHSSRFFPRNNTRRKSHDDDEAFAQRR